MIQYELRYAPARALLRPLIALRTTTAPIMRTARSIRNLGANRRILYRLTRMPGLCLAHTAAEVRLAASGINFEYTVEQERGSTIARICSTPGTGLRLNGNPRPAVVASTTPQAAEIAGARQSAEIARRRAIALSAPDDAAFTRALVLAADQFLVRRGGGSTVIAGYHWFSDWGRDTMIALPGLTLATGRYEDARGILSAFAESVDRGMLPNRFPDTGDSPEYNTVDATLWFFEAARALAAQTRTTGSFATRCSPSTDIVAWHERGTRYGIRMDSDGLRSRRRGRNSLDGCQGGRSVVTPRCGKPVESGALVQRSAPCRIYRDGTTGNWRIARERIQPAVLE